MLALRSGMRRQPPKLLIAPLARPIFRHGRLPLSTISTTTGGPSSSTPAPTAAKPIAPTTPIDFSDTAAAYSSLKTADLVRAYLVFRACGLRPLVTHADAVLRASYSVLGKTLTEALVKGTFFR